MMSSLRVLKILFFVLISAYATVLFLEKPVVFPDALRGIEAINQWVVGGHFNTLAYPDLAGDYNYFISWWTPGQWVIPFFFIVFLGLNTSIGLSIVIFLFTGLGLIGYFSLFRRLIPNRQIVWFSMLLLITNQSFIWHYLVYFGGDLFVFALLPFYLILILKLTEHFCFRTFFALLMLSVIGFYFKGTFLIYTFAAIVTVLMAEALRTKKITWNSVLIPLGGLLVFGIVYFTFLVFGETPGGTTRTGVYENIQDSIFADLFYPFGSLVGVLTRLSLAIQKLQFHTGFRADILLIVPFSLTFWFIRKIGQTRNTDVRALLVFSLSVLSVFTILYLADRAVSYDMRHFASLSFLFLPYFVEAISKMKKHKILVTGLIVLAIVDLGYLGYKVVQHRKQFVSHDGFRIAQSDAQIISFVKTYELSERDLIVVEDYWGLIPFFSSPKICIKRKNEQWFINSGMELVKGEEQLKLKEEKYDRVIVISKKDENKWSPQLLKFNHQQSFEDWWITVYKN